MSTEPAHRSLTAGAPAGRRALLTRVGAGFGSLALAALGGGATGFEGAAPARPAPHFAPRTRRIIFLFMHGGPSHVDSFDHKPALIRDHGRPLPLAKPRVQFAQTGDLLAPQWAFRQRGESGLWISDLFPEVATRADDLCLLNGMHTDNVVHGDAVLTLHTGSHVFVRPSMGAWISYGLGSENDDLPGFVTLSPSYAHGGSSNWGAGFLPGACQGTPIGSDKSPIRDAAIRHVSGGRVPPEVQRAQIDLLRASDAESEPDAAFEARVASFELAFRMQAAAPDLMDLSGESAETLRLYGVDDPVTDDFARQCLLARRMSERGVRFVQCSHSYKWDQHGNLRVDHDRNAREVDRPIAALLTDLRRRGLWEDTLVVWGGEFGRTPTAQGDDGRDHNPYGYTMWLAGGAVRGGITHGATDDYGYYAVEDRMQVHDLHATLLHCLGLDHTRLTFRHAGRDFRLTDVHGRVADAILA